MVVVFQALHLDLHSIKDFRTASLFCFPTHGSLQLFFKANQASSSGVIFEHRSHQIPIRVEFNCITCHQTRVCVYLCVWEREMTLDAWSCEIFLKLKQPLAFYRADGEPLATVMQSFVISATKDRNVRLGDGATVSEMTNEIMVKLLKDDWFSISSWCPDQTLDNISIVIWTLDF